MSNAIALTRESLTRLRLTGTEWRVLNQLLAHYDADAGDVRYTVGEIATDLGIAQPAISRAIRHLEDRRIIRRLHRAHWLINSHLVGPVIDADPEPEWSRP
jgi:DNA-binding MarR family transcriptional regulator